MSFEFIKFCREFHSNNGKKLESCSWKLFWAFPKVCSSKFTRFWVENSFFSCFWIKFCNLQKHKNMTLISLTSSWKIVGSRMTNVEPLISCCLLFCQCSYQSQHKLVWVFREILLLDLENEVLIQVFKIFSRYFSRYFSRHFQRHFLRYFRDIFHKKLAKNSTFPSQFVLHQTFWTNLNVRSSWFNILNEFT